MPNKALKVAAISAAGIAGTVGAVQVIRSGLRPESQLFGPTLISGNNPDEWALTYDDGPNPRSTPELLDVLARFGARATFFMMGKFVREQAELVRRVHAAGHIVGNHTMSHPFLATKSMSFVRREINDCSKLLEDTIGQRIRYFRAPFGARRPGILRFVREQGLVAVQWNVQGNDWEPIGVDGILSHIELGLARARQQRRGANILLHDGFDVQQGYDRGDTVGATQQLLQQGRQRGVRFVRVDAWT